MSVERTERIRVRISAEALCALYLVGERATVKLTGPAVAGRILEEICLQGQVKPILQAWRHRQRRERKAAENAPASEQPIT